MRTHVFTHTHTVVLIHTLSWGWHDSSCPVSAMQPNCSLYPHSPSLSDADAKELVPELFCTPAVLRNESGLALGRRHDGSAIDDVGLPAWAPSPEHFVRANTAVSGGCPPCDSLWAQPRHALTLALTH